ncbi:MAG: PD-(D/E)XK nuclease family protein [Myxococcales bacterium]
MTVYSHSRIASFEKCPKQFHYRYVLKIPAEREGIEAFMGKRVHEVLERLYEFAVRGQIPSLEQVIFRYHAFWDEHYDDKRVSIVKSGTPPSFYRDLGVRCIEYYYRRFHPFDQTETLGVEEEVQFTLDDEGKYAMRGVIDRVVRGQDGAIEVHDYKTGRYIPAQKELNQDRQLALYQIGLRDRYGDDQPYRLVWHYLQRKEQRTSNRTPEQLVTLRKDTMAVIDQIETAEDYPVQRNRLCDWCEYKDRCFAEHP